MRAWKILRLMPQNDIIEGSLDFGEELTPPPH